jgi:hypothetical protein
MNRTGYMKFCHVISIICIPAFIGLTIMAFVFYTQFLFSWQGVRDMALLYTGITVLDGVALTGAMLGVVGAKSFEPPKQQRSAATIVPMRK